MLSADKAPDALVRAAFCVMALLIVQIGLGIGNVLMSRPLIVAVAHNLAAASLLLSVVALTYFVFLNSTKRVWHG